jgi:hypothetical protein
VWKLELKDVVIKTDWSTINAPALKSELTSHRPQPRQQLSEASAHRSSKK